MTVAEYIELLKTFPQDAIIAIENLDEDGCHTGEYDTDYPYDPHLITAGTKIRRFYGCSKSRILQHDILVIG